MVQEAEAVGCRGGEGHGEPPPLDILVHPSSPAAPTASRDLGRLMGRGSPRPVLLPTGQGVIPGVQYWLPHTLSPAISKAPWPTLHSSAPHQGRSGGRLRF